LRPSDGKVDQRPSSLPRCWIGRTTATPLLHTRGTRQLLSWSAPPLERPPLVAKRMHGRRGESEQNSSRGPAMHPAAVLNPADTFADLTVGCALTGRPALAIGWQ